MAPQILIISDMPDVVEVLPEWLEREGYAVLITPQAADGLARAEEVQPSMIVVDALLTEPDGAAVCDLLRLNPVTATIPIVLLIERDTESARSESMRVGATDFIARPIQFPMLVARVQRLLRSDRAVTTDHVPMLEGMAYTVLTVLSSDMVWVLTVDADDRCLEHRAVVMRRGPDAAETFQSMLQQTNPEACFPLEPAANPLTKAVLDRRVLIDIPVRAFGDLPNGRALQHIFSQFEFSYLSVLPLVPSEHVVGVMVLASEDAALAESRSAQQILNSLTNQAAVVVDNARLHAALANRDTQVQAEQSFRRVIVEAMGDGVIVLGGSAIIGYANPQLLKLTGYRREELYGRGLDVLFQPDIGEQLVQGLASQQRVSMSGLELKTRHDGVVPVSVSGVVESSSNGHRTILTMKQATSDHDQQDALNRQTQRLQAINRAMRAVSSASSFEDVVQITLQSALQIVHGETALLLLRDVDQLAMFTGVLALGVRENAAATRQVTIGEGVVGIVAATGDSRLVADVKRSPDLHAEYAAIYGPVSSVLAVPLIAFDEVIGVLEVIDKTAGHFDAQDLRILESLVGAAAIAIENTRLFEQARDRVNALSTLLDVSSAVTSTLDFSDILERIARRLSLALHVQRVVIASWNRSSDRLALLSELVNVYWPPGDGPRRKRYELPLTYGLLTGDEPTEFVVNLQGNAPVERIPSGLHAVAGFALIVDRRVVGALTLYSEDARDTLSTSRVEAAREVIEQWHDVVAAYASDEWSSRPNLTDLCQRVLHAAGLRWVTITMLDRELDQLVLLREMGYALWSEQSHQVWSLDRHPTLARVLETGEPLVTQRELLHDDPDERAYLQDAGGHVCLIAPLLMRGESGGVVKLIDTEDPQREFDNSELSLCQGIANVVGNAMENAQLFAVQEQRASALEAAYKELQDADQLKEDLLQNLSHELRTPLTHILGYLRLMLDGAFGDLTAEQNETLELVTGKAENLATLVKDIVSVSESEQQNLMPKAIHLDRVIATAIRTMASKAQTKGIRIRPRIPANLPLVYADPERIGEVFEELLENAIKFSQDNSSIDVMVEDSGGIMLRAYVRDYGIGISSEDHEKIFRRFYQVESGTTRRFGGTGLGLAIVRQVVESHNGKVWLESVPGEGSCFYLTLPKATAMSNDR